MLNELLFSYWVKKRQVPFCFMGCAFVYFVVFVFGKTESTQKLNWAALYVYHIGIYSLLSHVKKKKKKSPCQFTCGEVSSPLSEDRALKFRCLGRWVTVTLRHTNRSMTDAQILLGSSFDLRVQSLPG